MTLDFDFSKNLITGDIILYMHPLKAGVTYLTLDIWDLNITSVSTSSSGALEYTITDPDPALGKALNITTPASQLGSPEYVHIKYTTQAFIAGSWLKPEQTAGKKMDYFFTQCQSIYCRNLAPLQDTPAVKSKYHVDIITEPKFVSRVSGNLTQEGIQNGKKVTSFDMDIPVESYLLAVAIGDLAEKKVGDRTYVITEPSMLDKAAEELDQLEDSLIKAEKYLTPYIWGDYKILILPPSFPFGGMENPLLTFASPTIIVGDKSSVDVATHEIAHSWTGNLVTNMNWENFWLNEGFTVFTERKVTKMNRGEVFYKVAAKLGNFSMVAAMEGYGWNHSYSSLTPIMNGANPDDSYSEIPYEKGFQFITYLESLVGEDLFQKFYQGYVTEFKYKSLTVDDMKNSYIKFVQGNFSSSKATELLAQIEWDKWIYEPGLPPVTLDFETEEYNDAVGLAHDYIKGAGKVSPDDREEYHTWFVTLKGIFLATLLDHKDIITSDIVNLIGKDLNIASEINAEILYLWYQLAIGSGAHSTPYTAETEFLESVGRLKYIQPLYTTLQQVDSQFAVDTYFKFCDLYHPIAQDFLEKALKVSKCSSAKQLTH